MAETEIGGAGFDWESTLWSVVLRAEDPEAARRAIESLSLRYGKPVYHFVRRRGHDVETAKDLTQEFYSYLLEKDLLSRARPEEESFRGYLRAILVRLLSDERDRRQAAKRGGEARRIAADFAEAETEFSYAPRPPACPEEAFERAWAAETFARVLERFRVECGTERAAWFEAIRMRFGIDGEGEAYSGIARRLGVPESDVTNWLHRSRTRLRELFEEELRPGTASSADLAEEIRRIGANL